MRTLSVMSRKGGTGKTTVTMCLGIAAHLRGYRVVIADMDPQGSTSSGFRPRVCEGPEVVEAAGGKIHQIKYTSEVRGIDFLIIDTPGTADANTLNAIHAAHACLVVTRPNYFDLAGAVSSADTIRQLAKPGLVMLNQTPPRRAGLEASSVQKAREALRFTRLPVADTTLCARAIYGTALSQGMSPEELLPNGAAAAELAALWGEAAALLAGGNYGASRRRS